MLMRLNHIEHKSIEKSCTKESEIGRVSESDREKM